LSTDARIRPGAVARGACVVFLFAGVCRTAKADFRPVLTFGVFHDGNVSVVGEGTGDDAAALAVALAWYRETPTSTFEFMYRPAYTAYRNFTDLDYFGNTVVATYARDWSRASRFTVDAYIARTDYQGQTKDNADRATTFVPRTTETLGTVKVGGTAGAGRRGLLDWHVRAGATFYEDVKDNPATAANEAHNFNDSTDVGGRVDWRDELSERNTLGAGVDVAYFGYETGPAVTVGTVGLVGTCQASPAWLIDYAAGASSATSDGDSVTGFSFNVKVDYSVLSKESTFSTGARQVFAPGTGLGGATQDRVVWTSYSHAPTARGLSGSLLASYSQRDSVQFGPTPPTEGDTSTTSASGSIGWSFNRFLALNAYGAYVDQQARNVADPVLAASLDTSYGSYGLFLRWAIRGR
jgi:hypothetical protein